MACAVLVQLPRDGLAAHLERVALLSIIVSKSATTASVRVTQ